MQNSLEYIEDENYYLINKVIKIDSKSVPRINNIRNLTKLIKKNNLWYYKNELLFNILFNIDNYESIIFKNNNNDDYRFGNLDIIYQPKYIFNKPENVEILEEFEPKLITHGHYAGQYRNMYWKVIENNEEYFIMHINEDTFTKFSLIDKEKIINFEIPGNKLIWYLNLGGYIATTIKLEGTKKCIYLHQYIMNVHSENNTDMKKTVDHINRDKLDNRKKNLRFANMSEQNSNRDKQKRQKNACVLPDEIKQSDFPKYVVYNNRCYNKEKNLWREFFTIKGHIKLEKCWASSKSNNVLIKEKLEQAKLKLKNLNGEISDEAYKKLITNKEFNIPYIKLTIFRNKYHLIFERGIKVDDKRTRQSLKMVLDSNDLQLMLDKFIVAVNNKYKELNIESHKLENITMLDFSTVDNEIIEEIYEDSETLSSIDESDNNLKAIDCEKYKVNPDLPANFSLYKEKSSWYLSFSKHINTVRYNKKIVMKSMHIQNELDRLIDNINKIHPYLNIEKYTVINSYDFTDNTLLKENIKPILPRNFCVYNGVGKDYIQFTKKIDGKTISYKTAIKSYDLQKDLNTFVNYLNQEYKLDIEDQQIIETNNWRTVNKIK